VVFKYPLLSNCISYTSITYSGTRLAVQFSPFSTGELFFAGPEYVLVENPIHRGAGMSADIINMVTSVFYSFGKGLVRGDCQEPGVRHGQQRARELVLPAASR
jgi:hypothetical protein